MCRPFQGLTSPGVAWLRRPGAGHRRESARGSSALWALGKAFEFGKAEDSRKYKTGLGFGSIRFGGAAASGKRVGRLDSLKAV